ncbi:type II toxin-antitoxin system prevent-host-death family antitoxin [Iamia sp.]|jgi:prevent-host-death family protein|uniref:type II toxin-antitoxin system Phd/YefM family antitoxin n=1 Tax=Iamia sp. TaxID=2722710 RepID=UPI002BFDC55C|nr:type II toxin-antitoxin system prevent-host-death family antitoxin [Iamia sp.]HXH59156.1 type II toxin-antitoxin system prevent-host-death family antitoxin [Iamia sp.]
MAEVASRELRNHTADVLRRVEAGEEITITVRGRPVAQVVPLRRRRWVSGAEMRERLSRVQADPGLRDDLERLAGDTTDDLGPIV